MSVGGSKGSSESSRQVDIPEFLRPFLEQGADVASGQLGALQAQTQDPATAGFTPDQLAAFEQARGVAGGAGGFLPTAQNTFLEAAQGQDLSSFLDPTALAALQASAGGGGGLEGAIPPSALAALQATAGGEFLTGGAGFESALAAATRQAQRSAASAFGGSAGGLGSGLSRTAVGTGVGDAFSGLFNAERNRQLGAAGQLTAAQQAQQQRALQSSGLLGQFGQNERSNQLNAAGQLPGIGLAGSNILGTIGRQQQQQGQREIDAPFNRNLQVLAAALGGLPISNLLGQSGESSSNQFGLEAGTSGDFSFGDLFGA